jgi:hypothetical protein
MKKVESYKVTFGERKKGKHSKRKKPKAKNKKPYKGQG